MALVLLSYAFVMDRILILSKPDGAANELANVLVRDGFDACAVDSPEVASAELALRRYDLVLVDLDRRAIDVAREVRTAYPATRELPERAQRGRGPRVILTGCVPLTQRQLERLDCGAVAFFPKPFDLAGAAVFMRRQLDRAPWTRRLWHAEQPTSYAP